MIEGLALWNKIEVTDPRFTKKFDRGQFKGTAVDALMNVKRLTEHFGPVGQNWGWTILNERLDTFGEGDNAQTIHSLTLRLWFVHDGEKREFDHIGHTKVAYWSRSQPPRLVVDDEFGKKSLTDALAKAMSCLGASADVWLGRFDGNKHYQPPEQDEPAPRPVLQEPPDFVLQRQPRQPERQQAKPGRSPTDTVDAVLAEQEARKPPVRPVGKTLLDHTGDVFGTFDKRSELVEAVGLLWEVEAHRPKIASNNTALLRGMLSTNTLPPELAKDVLAYVGTPEVA